MIGLGDWAECGLVGGGGVSGCIVEEEDSTNPVSDC